jgi:hypothetical protein
MLLIVCVILTIVYLFTKTLKPKRFPPGPPRLPYVGGIPYIAKDKSLMQTLRKLADGYGPLAGVYLGSKPVVVISDYELLKSNFFTFMP